MLDLRIECLHLNIQNAAGQEHRIQPITLRALDVVAERLQLHLADAWPATAGSDVESVRLVPVSLCLDAMSDEQAANEMAGALVEALALKLKW